MLPTYPRRVPITTPRRPSSLRTSGKIPKLYQAALPAFSLEHYPARPALGNPDPTPYLGQGAQREVSGQRATKSSRYSLESVSITLQKLGMNEKMPLQAHFGPFRIDEAEARLERDGQAIELAPRAFQVLCALVRRPGKLISKDVLLDLVWGHRHVNEAALKNLVSQLRQALDDDARQPRFIETATRRGYRFIASVSESAQGFLPLPAVPASSMAFTRAPHLLMGREKALARLHAAFTAMRAGQRQAVFVVGDAGMGKSTLIERFIAEADNWLAIGQCIEHYGTGEPYMPVLEALNTLCRADDGTIVEMMRRVAPTWLVQLPWFIADHDRQTLVRETIGVSQERMLREFGELIDRLAANRPLLLVLEDLHWSDYATVQLIDYLVRRRHPAAVMLLGTFRPAELIQDAHPLGQLRSALQTRRLCEEIDLESLSEIELGNWLAARLGEPAPQHFVQTLHAHTAGLPLFVVNVVDELLSSGALRRIDQAWCFPDTAALGVPRSIIGLIESQIARLTPEQQRVLGAASVAGIEFSQLPLAAVLQTTPETLQALLDDLLVRLPWLRTTGASSFAGDQLSARHAFGHALYRASPLRAAA